MVRRGVELYLPQLPISQILHHNPSPISQSATYRRYIFGMGGFQTDGNITKTGDKYLRRMLIGCAHYILGPFGPDTDLRRFGLRLAEHGGKAAKKRAAVAVARKLAVLLHRLWITGEAYEPIGYSEQHGQAA